MAIDRSDVEKIIAGVVGVSVVGLGIAALIDAVIDGGDTFVPSYDGNNDRDSSGEDDEDEYYDYADVPAEDEVFEADRIQREMDSMWNEHQVDEIWDEYNAGGFQERDLRREYEVAQREFETKNNSIKTEYIYLDFTQNMKSGSYRNRNDVYQESIEDQFEKIQRKLMKIFYLILILEFSRNHLRRKKLRGISFNLRYTNDVFRSKLASKK